MESFLSVNRPLTQEELAERRAIARQRHAEKMAAAAAAAADTSVPATTPRMSILPDATENGPSSQYIQEAEAEPEDERDQIFVAFARVFSGTVRRGQKLYVLGPKHDPAKLLQEV